MAAEATKRTGRRLRSTLKSPLTPAEETELAAAWQQHKDLKARERLVMSIYHFLQAQAARIGKTTSVPREDLLQEALLGAMRAADTFDPSKTRFITYANYWVRCYVKRRIAEDRTILSNSTIRHQSSKRGQQHNQNRALIKVLWLDDYDAGDGECAGTAHNAELSHVIAALSEPAADESMLDKLRMFEELRMLVEDLPHDERWVIQQRYMTGDDVRTLGELCTLKGCSREWIRQLEKRAIQSLQKAAKDLFDS